MGRPKQSLPFGETTMMGRVVEQAERSGLDGVVAVIGQDDPPPPSWRAQIVVNEAPEAGSLSSLLVAAESIGSFALMVLLADMPGLSSVDINRMLEAWQAEPRWAAVARYTDGLGHPLILSPFLVAALEGKTGDKVLWPMLETAPEGEILHVDINHYRPIDVNTPEDYARVCAQAGFEPD